MNKVAHAIVLLGAGLLAISTGGAATEQQPREPAKVEAQLLPGQYRVVIEPLVEPPGKIAVYRIQIQTVTKQKLSLTIDGGNVSETSQFSGDGKLYHASYIIVISLRETCDPALRGQKLLLEQRAMVGGAGRGQINHTITVDANVTLEKIIDFPPSTKIETLGQKYTIGKLRGQAVEIVAGPRD